MKKIISIPESLCLLLLLLISLLAIAIILPFLDIRGTMHIIYYYIYITIRVLIVLMVAMTLILIPINKWTISKGLPVDCLYNPFGVIEIHIGRKCRKSRRLFMKTCLEVILLGIDKNKNILFDSWIIPKTKMMDIFGDAVEFPTTSFCQKLNNIYSKIIYKASLKKQSYRCIIYVNRISNKQQEDLRRKLMRLEIGSHIK